MRHGELLGLKWSNIDLEKGTLHAQRTVVSINGIGWKETAPKTRKSKQTIILAQFAIGALREHRKWQLEERLKALSWTDRDLVFPEPKGNYIVFSRLHYQFKSILEKAELPEMRFHDLRHSCATLLRKMGVDTKVIQNIPGHSSYEILASP